LGAFDRSVDNATPVTTDHCSETYAAESGAKSGMAGMAAAKPV